jgi:hypothetical protein
MQSAITVLPMPSMPVWLYTGLGLKRKKSPTTLEGQRGEGSVYSLALWVIPARR